MKKQKQRLGPFEVEIERMGPRGVGIGVAPDGRVVQVRAAPPGARVLVVPQGRKGKVLLGRRLVMIRPPPDAARPPCPLFGTCGGCVLQELSLAAQRRFKQDLAWRELEEGRGATLELPRVPPVGVGAAYGVRNKLELSFGVRRWLTDAEEAAGASRDGRFLGLHPPGRFDRLVDVTSCLHGSPAMAALVAVVRAVALAEDQPPPWDTLAHTGYWRHLVVREGHATGALLVAVHTAPGPRAPVAELARALFAAALPDGKRLVGVVWVVDPGVADAALGEAAEVFGDDTFEERIGPVPLTVSRTAFVQTTTQGAEVLYGVIDGLLDGHATGGTLLDLYCGLGSIGLFLAHRFDRVVGVEVVAAAIDGARHNAARMGVSAEFVAAPVESVLDLVRGGDAVTIVVDPPRAGLHPSVAARLAQTPADVLIYVACNAASLGRDAVVLEAGGWRFDHVVVVDLFPQTGHVEVVARFVRAVG
jgi:23S rRNA (uracil1939-C5)-methyltransferase